MRYYALQTGKTLEAKVYYLPFFRSVYNECTPGYKMWVEGLYVVRISYS